MWKEIEEWVLRHIFISGFILITLAILVAIIPKYIWY
jgi:hypothetical protein